MNRLLHHGVRSTTSTAFARAAVRAMGIAAAVLACLVLPAASHAGTGFRVMLPGWPQKPGAPFTPGVTTAMGVTATPLLAAPTTPATGNKTGLVLTLDTTWVEGNGYRPIRITVAPTVPTVADRSLRISFRPGAYRGASMAVTRDIELPAGFSSITTRIAVPQVEPWQTFAFDVFEDGEHLRELSFPQNYMGMGVGQYSGDNASPSMLILNSAINSNQMLNEMGRAGQPVLEVGPSKTVSTSGIYLPGNPPRQAVASMANTIPTLADLPDRWIEYSMLDIIVASRQDLQTLTEQHPDQWRAIRRWLSAGGNLWVYGVGEVKPRQNWTQWNLQSDKPWKYLDELNQRLDFPPLDDTTPWSSDAPAELRGWNPPDPNASDGYPNQYAMDPRVYRPDIAAGQIVTTPFQPTFTDPRFPFVMRPLGQGMVVAIPDGDPSNNPQFPWRLVFSNVGGEHWHWSTRHGVNFNGQNENYWNFLIPGVGAAPVTAFQMLITLFVLVIGPLNFYVLRRWNKLNLLLITVPVSAAIVTAALLLYAVISDGFGVRVRTRSFTEIDQKTGEAVCLGRANYYAGLTPAKGLAFSGDTTVYPLNESARNTAYESGVTRRLAWDFAGEEDHVGTQLLESGWLQSRIQTQLLTVRARQTTARLDISRQGGRATSVVNQLGVPVSLLLLRDAAGEYSVVRDLDAGAKSDLNALADGDSPAELTRLNPERTLQPPDGMQLGGSHAIFGIRRRNYGRRYTNTGMPIAEMMQAGMLERSLGKTLTAALLRQLPPRSYVAIVERSPEFELGIDSATDESSLHVIYGRW